MLSKSFPDAKVVYARQACGKGALEAAEVGIQRLGAYEGNVMVLPANMPLLQADTTLLCLEAMIAEGVAGTSVRFF